MGGGGLMVYRALTQRKRVFISFDYDYDRHYRYLLSALNANSSSDIEFEDVTPSEIQTSDIGRIKGVLTTKIRNATHTLSIVGEHANDYHSKWMEIGERNWLWWEARTSRDEGRKLIAVKVRRSYVAPDPLLSASTTWVNSFDVAEIVQAIASS
jgi:hypothetical protein